MTSLQELSSRELFEQLRTLESARPTDGDSEGTLHDLHLHQLELEMQNRALRDAQESLEESRAHYAELYDHAPVGYLTVDRNGWVLQANLTAAELVGRKREELVGAPFASAANLVDPIPFFRHLRSVERSGGTEIEELDSDAREGGRRLQITTRPVRARKASSAEYHVILTDVTEARRAQLDRAVLDKERRARAAADAANHMKDQFLGMVSHELRTPLNALLGWADILGGNHADPALLERGLAVIQRSGHSLARLVDDILDVSRIVSGKLRFEMKDLKVDAIVRSAIDNLRGAAAERKVVFRVAMAAPCRTKGDAGRLEQVVTNLLSNAVKFSDEGGAIDVVLDHDETAVRLRVHDEGCGIDGADLPHVFDSFRQGAGATTRTQRGLGLGLTIARHIVEAHHGSIHARSDGRGRGATFTVELPFHDRQSSRPPPAAPSDRPARSSIAGLSILCVDDDDATLELVEITLGARGAVVHTARSVSEAHVSLGSTRPDVVVTDIAMAGRDGYDLLAAARSLPPPLSSLPVIAMTARAQLDEADRTAMAGFDGYLSKPVDFEELVRVICGLMPAE